MKENNWDRWKNSSYPEIRVKRVWVNEFQLYYLLQSNLQIEPSAFLDDSSSHAVYFKSGIIFSMGNITSKQRHFCIYLYMFNMFINKTQYRYDKFIKSKFCL